MKLKLNVLLMMVTSLLMFACIGPDSGGGDDNSTVSSSTDADLSADENSSDDVEQSSATEAPESSSDSDTDSSESGVPASSEANTGSSDVETDSSVPEMSSPESSTESSDESSTESSDDSTADPKLEQCGDKCGDAEVIDGHTLYLYEEFDREIKFGETMAFDGNPAEDWLWTFGDGTFGGNLTRFKRENIDVSNGSVKITQKAESCPGSVSFAQRLPTGEYEEVGAREISGGEMRTHVKDFHYGIYKVKMKVDKVPGTGNTFATFFAYNIPRAVAWREIDIEVVSNHPTSGEIITNLISVEGIKDEDWTDYGTGEFAMEYPANGSHNFSDGYDANDGEWHEYSFDWKPGEVTWYIDGNVIREYKEDADNKAHNRVLVPDMPLAIFMNFWTPDFFDAPSPSDWPLVAEYDYIKYYRWDSPETHDPEVLIPLQ